MRESYMPYYHFLVTEPLQRPTGEEIIECKTVNIAKASDLLQPGELLLVKVGLAAARKKR